MPSARERRPRPGRATLVLSLICFAVYVGDVLIAKLASLGSFAWPYELGGVSQFLVVLLGSAFLVASALRREAAKARQQE